MYLGLPLPAFLEARRAGISRFTSEFFRDRSQYLNLRSLKPNAALQSLWPHRT